MWDDTFTQKENGNTSATVDGITYTFRSFLRYITVTDTWEYNEHWERLTDRVLPCEIKYDFIGKIETLEEDFNYLSKYLLCGGLLTRQECFIPPNQVQDSGNVQFRYGETPSLYCKEGYSLLSTKQVKCGIYWPNDGWPKCYKTKTAYTQTWKYVTLPHLRQRSPNWLLLLLWLAVKSRRQIQTPDPDPKTVGCSTASLGVKYGGTLDNSAITAVGTLEVPVYFARLNHPLTSTRGPGSANAWFFYIPIDPYVQVIFESTVTVISVVIQDGQAKRIGDTTTVTVTSIKISHGIDLNSIDFIEDENGDEKIFAALDGSTSMITIELDSPIEAKIVRIHPISFEQDDPSATLNDDVGFMRFDLEGCNKE